MEPKRPNVLKISPELPVSVPSVILQIGELFANVHWHRPPGWFGRERWRWNWGILEFPWCSWGVEWWLDYDNGIFGGSDDCSMCIYIGLCNIKVTNYCLVGAWGDGTINSWPRNVDVGSTLVGKLWLLNILLVLWAWQDSHAARRLKYSMVITRGRTYILVVIHEFCIKEHFTTLD